MFMFMAVGTGPKPNAVFELLRFRQANRPIIGSSIEGAYRMVSAVGSHGNIPFNTHKPEKAETLDAASRAKSAKSVGHQAKAAIAELTDGDLPNNAQGKMASAIARGVNFAVLFAGKNEEPAAENIEAEAPVAEDTEAPTADATDILADIIEPADPVSEIELLLASGD
jgi:hypothetical protein